MLIRHLLLACLVLSGSLVAAEEKLPTTDEVIAGLAKAEAKIKTLEVSTDYVKIDAFLRPKPLTMKLSAHCVVETSGKLAYEVEGEQASNQELYAGRWQGTYDGETFRALSGTLGRPWTFGEIDRHWSMHGVHPLEFTTHYFHKSLVTELKSQAIVVVGHETFHDRAVIVVETKPLVNAEPRKQHFLIDPERWVVMQRAVWRQPKDKPWRAYTRIDTWDYVEVEKGIWLPNRVHYASVSHDKNTDAEIIDWSYEGTNHDWKVNPKLTDKTFHLEFPPDVSVTDRTKG